MKGILKKLKLKRLVATLLLIITVGSSFSPVVLADPPSATTTQSSVSRASSQELIATYMKLRDSNKITGIDTINALTPADLAVIGVWLSNFYAPYGTSLDGDTKKSNVDALVPILQNIGFDRDAARQIVEIEYDYTLNTASQLYVNISSGDLNKVYGPVNSNGYHPGYTEWDANGEEYRVESADYMNFRFSNLVGSGGVDTEFEEKVGECYSRNDGSWDVPVTLGIWNALLTDVSLNTGKTYKFYWHEGAQRGGKDGKGNASKLPSFTLNQEFVALYGVTIADGKFDMGLYGNAVFNGKVSGGTDSSDVLNMSESDLYSLLYVTQKIYVDWVGNIICDFGTHRAVVVPSVMNPSTFVTIENGQATSDFTIMCSSSFGINYFNRGQFQDNGTYKVTIPGSVVKMTMARGNKGDVSFDTITGWHGPDEDGAKALKDIIKEILGGGDYTYDDNSGFTYYYVGRTAGTDIDSRNGICKINASQPVYTKLCRLNDSMADLLNGKAEGLSFDNFWCSDNINKYFTQRSKFANIGEDFNTIIDVSSNDYGLIADLFLTYLLAYSNVTDYSNCPDIGIAFNVAFPTLDPTLTITWATTDATQEEALSFIYYLLHPSKGVEYFVTLVKNKVSGLLVGMHEDMVGNTDSNVSLGATKYIGFTGYVTIPNLNDIDWLAWLISMYDVIVVYLIILMCIILFCYIIVGQLSFHKAFINLFLFSLLAFLPPVAINTVINTINESCNVIYSNKFDYWAMVQTQEYLSTLGIGDDISTSMGYNVDSSAGDLSAQAISGFNTVKVKWATPKRLNELAEAKNQLDEYTSGDGVPEFGAAVSIALNAQEATSGVEEFIDSASATYLYRDYMDIYKYGSVSYNIYSDRGFNFKGMSRVDPEVAMFAVGGTESRVAQVWTNTLTSGPKLGLLSYQSGQNIKKYVMSNIEGSNFTSEEGIKDTSSLNAIRRGFLFPTVSTNGGCYYTVHSLAPSLLLRFVNPLNTLGADREHLENIYENGLNITLGELDDLDTNSYIGFGIGNKEFSYTVNSLMADGRGDNLKGASKDLSYLYFALYSESPYYFFNYNIRDQVVSSNVGYDYNKNALNELDYHSGHFKTYLLQDNQSLFYNMSSGAGDGYGEMRDFMNFHDFFYYVLPLLQYGNETVNIFNSIYGMYTYSDCSFSIDASGSYKYNGEVYNTMLDLVSANKNSMDEEDMYKLWHDFNVYSLFNTYTTWLATMNDCNYAKPESIYVSGRKFVVVNPLDPTSYYTLDDAGNLKDGRYMVFSRSEMAYYGLKYEDLTQVEQKIINVQDNVYAASLDLMNYYTLSDETLINAFAFIQTFEFNKEFSQKSLISADLTLYPQSYELKAFTYDAYLRLILSQSTIESLMDGGGDGGNNKSIYTRILENTSIFFGVVLLANDFIAIYILPALRFFFIIILFFMSIIMIVAAAIKLDEDSGTSLITTAWHSLIAPLLSFSAISIGLAFLVSLFMSDGPTKVTNQRHFVITLGDPTMAIAVILVINCVAIYLYFKICKKCLKDLIHYAKAVGASITGVVAGAARKLGVAMANGRQRRRMSAAFANAVGKGSDYNGSASGTAEQRGKDNTKRGGSFMGGLLAGTATGAALAGDDDEGSSGGGSGHGSGSSDGSGSGSSGSSGSSEKPKNKYDAMAEAASEKQFNKADKLNDKAKKAKANAEKLKGKSEAYSARANEVAKEHGGKDAEWTYTHKKAEKNARRAEKAQKKADKLNAKSEKMLNKSAKTASGKSKGFIAKTAAVGTAKFAAKTMGNTAKLAGSAVKTTASGVKKTASNVATYGLVGGLGISAAQGVKFGATHGVKAIDNAAASGVRGFRNAKKGANEFLASSHGASVRNTANTVATATAVAGKEARKSVIRTGRNAVSTAQRKAQNMRQNYWANKREQ